MASEGFLVRSADWPRGLYCAVAVIDARPNAPQLELYHEGQPSGVVLVGRQEDEEGPTVPEVEPGPPTLPTLPEVPGPAPEPWFPLPDEPLPKRKPWWRLAIVTNELTPGVHRINADDLARVCLDAVAAGASVVVVNDEDFRIGRPNRWWR